MTDNGNRTHEPSLRELTAELDGLRELMLAKIESVTVTMNERDHRYEDHFSAMNEKTGAALAASEKAIVKAEAATEKRFESVNEFRTTLSDQARDLMGRGEANAKFNAVEEKLSVLRDDVTRGVSQGVGGKAVKDESRANIAMAVSALGALLGVLAAIYTWTR